MQYIYYNEYSTDELEQKSLLIEVGKLSDEWLMFDFKEVIIGKIAGKFIHAGLITNEFSVGEIDSLYGSCSFATKEIAFVEDIKKIYAVPTIHKLLVLLLNRNKVDQVHLESAINCPTLFQDLKLTRQLELIQKYKRYDLVNMVKHDIFDNAIYTLFSDLMQTLFKPSQCYYLFGGKYRLAKEFLSTVERDRLIVKEIYPLKASICIFLGKVTVNQKFLIVNSAHKIKLSDILLLEDEELTISLLFQRNTKVQTAYPNTETKILPNLEEYKIKSVNLFKLIKL